MSSPVVIESNCRRRVRPRGPYKKYLLDTTIPIPYSTFIDHQRMEKLADGHRLRQSSLSDITNVVHKNNRSAHVAMNANCDNGDVDMLNHLQSSENYINSENITVHETNYVHMSGTAAAEQYDYSSDESEDMMILQPDLNDELDFSSVTPSTVPTSHSNTTSNNDNAEHCGNNEQVNDVDNNKYDEPLYDGCRVSKKELKILILGYSIRHHLTDLALEDLMKIINYLLPCDHDVLPSKYLFLKNVDKSPRTLKKYFCPECYVLLEFNSEQTEVLCSSCNSMKNKKILDNNCHFYVHIPLTEQLENFVNGPDFKLLRKDVGAGCNNFKDVTSASYYKTLKDKNMIAEHDLTFQLNTDGVCPMRSSAFSIWPIQLMINEFPITLRRNKIILCGLWFHKQKPPMHLYFEFLIKELQCLNSVGIEQQATGIFIKFHLIMCSVDSVARAMVQNIHQYNGTFGCTYCLAEGEICNNTRIYPGSTIGPIRTERQHFRDASLTMKNGVVVNGVKGPTILSYIKTFDVTQSFCFDYMHTVLLGVCKTFLEAWLDSSNHEEVWYLGKHIDNINAKLLIIEPPKEISRTPRSLHERAKWKANELKSFLLYYSYPCITDFMPSQYLQHWAMLIYPIYIYLKPSFTEEENCKARVYLKEFVEKVGNLYGKQFYRFNLHLLLHIPDQVQAFGALWATSTFPFESYNGAISKMFVNNSPRVPQQISKNYYRMQATGSEYAKLKDSLPDEFHHIFRPFNFTRNPARSTHLLSPKLPKKITLSMTLKTVIEQYLHISSVSDDADDHCMIMVNGVTFHSARHSKFLKRNNSVALLQNNNFVIVKSILTVNDNCTGNAHCILECQPLSHIRDKDFEIKGAVKQIFTVVQPTTTISVTTPQELTKKCVLVPFKKDRKCCNNDHMKYIVIPLVNNLEND